MSPAMRSHDRLFAQLIRRAGRLPGVIIRPSRWSHGLSVWAGGKEILHAETPGVIDIRLTRPLIRDLGRALTRDGRVMVRKAPSDWLWIRMSGANDIRFILRLLQRAGAQPPGKGSRRRRFTVQRDA